MSTCLFWSRKNSPVFSMTCSSLSWEYGCSWQKVSISHTVTPKAHTSLAVVNLPWRKEKDHLPSINMFYVC